MDARTTADIFLFEGFRLDRRRGGLFRRNGRGDFIPVAIGSRALDVLGVLIRRPGELVSKDELIAAVWRGTVVEDSNLTVQISALRRVLGNGRSHGNYIETIPGRGYRFIAAVTHAQNAADVVRAGFDVDEAAGAEHAPASASVASVRTGDGRQKRLWPALSILTALAAIGLLVALTWDYRWFDGSGRPHLSIVVLPFTNLGNHPDQEYFADGITDNLTTDLSRITDSFVISRNTAFTYRNKPADTKRIGRELGVRYVLEGSVQRSGDQVRVNTQLINAETDAHLWAERFDRDMGDLFALQNEITGRIAVALGGALIAAEANRPTDHPDALDYIFRGRAALLKPLSRESYAEGIGLIERALALDPRSVEAQSRLASALVGRVLDEMSASGAGDIARADGLIRQALAASPLSPLVHFAKGQLLRATGRCDEAISEYETALASNRNWASALANIGRCKIYIGPIEEASPLEEQAIRLSPLDPQIGVWYFRIGQAHVVQSRIDEAIVWLEKARSANPGLPYVHAWLAAGHALKGKTERAAAELAEARRLSVDNRYSSIAHLKTGGWWGVPRTSALFETTYFAGLRKAGMPDE